MPPYWTFPSNNYGPINGIADSGVETFKGDPMKSLAREICQNSLDARGDDSEPVHVEFEAFELEPSQIPGESDLKDAFSRALDLWSEQESDTAKEFFRTALSVLSGAKVKCLRISDFNTSGLTGSDKEFNSPWCNLIKSSGVSDKSGSSGGSFGIGKFAPFACSVLRTVFYSTSDKNGAEAYQGVSRITSFRDKNGEFTQGTGYFGNERSRPVSEQLCLEPGYSRSRDSRGTDIYILGFAGGEDWKRQMTASILDGFLISIFNGSLTADVNGIIIDKSSLDDLMKTYKEDLAEHADEYYQVLIDDKLARTFVRERTDYPRGKLTLKLMIMPGFHSRVAMVRQTGMKISDRGGINQLIPFAGVMYIEGTELNVYLRGMENPQHIKWESKRAEDPGKARKVLAYMTSFIRKSLDDLKNDDSEEVLDPSVGAYLSLPSEKSEDSQNKAESLSDRIQSVKKSVISPAPKPSKENFSGSGAYEPDSRVEDSVESDSAGGSREGSRSEGSSAGNGPGRGSGDGGNGNQNAESLGRPSRISPVNVHAAVKDRISGEYIIFFTPGSSAENGYIDILTAAESDSYKAEILSASCPGFPELQTKGNRISGLSFAAGKTLKISVKLNCRDYCALEVNAYGNKV